MPLDADSIRARLPEREVVWLDTIGVHHGRSGGPPAGNRGRRGPSVRGAGPAGRVWYSEKGTGLYVSIVLRPGIPPETLPTLTLALGLAVREAILRSTGVVCALKWPNDVLAGGRKCAGILAQGTTAAVVAAWAST